MRRALVMVAVIGATGGCGDEKSLEDALIARGAKRSMSLDAGQPHPPSMPRAPIVPAPPRPLPNAAQPSRSASQRSLLAFLHDHATGGPWRVTVHELGDPGGGFLRRTVKHTGTLDPAVSDELISLLGKDASFDVSAYQGAARNCTGSSLGIRLDRDGARFDMVYECGHVRLGEDAPRIDVSPTMYALMAKVEAWALPCAPLVIDSLDVEICAPRGARFAGGPPSNRLISAPQAACAQLSVGTATPADTKYVRKIGALELACRHNDEPACIKMCKTLRPVPNSTATAPFPPGPPVIESSVSGTWIPFHSVEIWTDGTIVFSGRGCTKARGHRAKVTPQQVASLLAKIKATGFLTAEPPPPGGMIDAPIVRLRVTVDGRTKEMRLGGGEESAELSASQQFVNDLVGENPCRW